MKKEVAATTLSSMPGKQIRQRVFLKSTEEIELWEFSGMLHEDNHKGCTERSSVHLELRESLYIMTSIIFMKT